MGYYVVWASYLRHVFMVIAVCVLMCSVDSNGEVVQRPVFSEPTVTYCLREGSVDTFTAALWGRSYNLWDYPVSTCGSTFWQEGHLVGDYYIIDKSQEVLRNLGTRVDDGDVKLVYVLSYNGESWPGPFNRPTAVTMDPFGYFEPRNDEGQFLVYVADAGNNRITRITRHTAYYTGTMAWLFPEEYTVGNTLNCPQDIDFCPFYDGSNPSLGMLFVADTYNHRVLALSADGSLIWEIGGPEPGDGINQFSYPWAITASRLNESNQEAYVYVSDRGNNRVVLLKQEPDSTIHWVRHLEMPNYSPEPLAWKSGGITDIETDDVDFLRSGVFAVDATSNELIQFDNELTTAINRYSFGIPGTELVDLSLSRGGLVVQRSYTDKTGLEVYEIRASIEDLSVSLRALKPPDDFEFISFNVTSSAAVSIWVEHPNANPSFVDSLVMMYPVRLGPVWAVWDGRDPVTAQVLDPGTYRIKVLVEDDYWIHSELDSIDVEIVENHFARELCRHEYVSMPDWSPDGSSIVYSAGGAGVNSSSSIYKCDLNGNETRLTALDDGKHLAPSWSPDGHYIAWTKELLNFLEGGPKRAVYIMDSDGGSQELISDTTGALIWFREETPRWVPPRNRISYTKNRLDGYFKNQIDIYSMVTGTVVSDFVSSGWISDYAWSPTRNELALAMGPSEPIDDSVQVNLYAYDEGSTLLNQLTSEPEAAWRQTRGVDWSPDGQRIVFTENWIAFGEETRWDVFTIQREGAHRLGVFGLGSDVSYLYSGVTWSPDGTKIAFAMESTLDTNVTALVIADYKRVSFDAFPSTIVVSPLPFDTISGVTAVEGSIDTNYSVSGGYLLSVPKGYYVDWGMGDVPGVWETDGVELVECTNGGESCVVSNDTIALLNTGVIPGGPITLRIVSYDNDGPDSSIVKRRVYVNHRRLEVAKYGQGDYTVIQEAIDAAGHGDTISVQNGTYAENLVIKEAVVVCAAGDSVVILGSGDQPTVVMSGHQYPCQIAGFTITNPVQQSHVVGLYIDSSSPLIRSCRFVDYKSQSYGGGVRIVGNSAPEFVDCEFLDNRSGFGGAAAVWGTDYEYPTASFSHCRFSGNEAINGSGGAIGIQYEHHLDSTFVQPVIIDCIFDNNTSTISGTAVSLTNLYKARLEKCVFSNNEASGSPSSWNVIGGDISGALFYRCTWVSNDRQNSSFDIIGLRGAASVYDAIEVRNCLFAFNDGATAIVYGYRYNYYIEYSDFFANNEEDSIWLSRGVENINKNPAFCDAENGIYSLYAFSPCAEGISETGQAGALGIDCVPPADVLVVTDSLYKNEVDTVLTTCPKGDHLSLQVMVDLDDEVMTRTIEPEEMTALIGTSGHMSVFDDDGVIFADSAATELNLYKTTITHRWFGGYGIDTVTVLLNGVPLDEKAIVNLRSYDEGGPGYTSGDGVVDILDFGWFSESYQSPPKPYVHFRDFNADSLIDLVDFSDFSSHYMHGSSFPQIPTGSREKPLQTENSLTLDFTEETQGRDHRELRVEITLENVAIFKAMCVSLKQENERLAYKEWIVNEQYSKPVLVCQVCRDGINQIFIGIVGSKSKIGNTLRLGTLVFEIDGTEELDIAEDDFELLVGDVLPGDGGLGILRGVSLNKGRDILRIYHNVLSQNYPNPFNPQTTISYSIAKDSHVDLKIYDVSGRLVRILESGHRNPNVYKVVWDGKNNKGQSVASGVYFYRLIAGDFEATRKMVLLR